MYPNPKVARDPATPPIAAVEPEPPFDEEEELVDWKRVFCARIRAFAGARGMGRRVQRATLPAFEAIRFDSIVELVMRY